MVLGYVYICMLYMKSSLIFYMSGEEYDFLGSYYHNI